MIQLRLNFLFWGLKYQGQWSDFDPFPHLKCQKFTTFFNQFSISLGPPKIQVYLTWDHSLWTDTSLWGSIWRTYIELPSSLKDQNKLELEDRLSLDWNEKRGKRSWCYYYSVPQHQSNKLTIETFYVGSLKTGKESPTHHPLAICTSLVGYFHNFS